ncbi:MAG: Gfo/Idh/MocA family protein, partial [Armatimonadota bacterium]
REFLRRTGSAAVGAGLGLMAQARRSAHAQEVGANEKVVLGLIGAGGRGTGIMRTAMRCPGVEVAAVCDVYDQRRDRAREVAGEQAKTHLDYRRVLDNKDIDAVIIGTPDHWHHDIFCDAIQAGKDIYCEKPMSKTIEEGRHMVGVARASKQVVQIGTQRRSGQQYPQARQLIEDGKIGRIRFVRAYDCRNYTQRDPFHPPAEFAGKIDWERFLGRAPRCKFDPFRYFAWRWFWDYAGGLVTDVGVHVLDVVHWLTGNDTPRSVVCHGGMYELEYWQTPDVVNVVLDYGSHSVGLTFNFANKHQGNGIMFYGTDATMEVRRSDIHVFSEQGSASEPEITIPASGWVQEHVQNFIDCVRSRAEPAAPVELGFRSLLPLHLANMAYRERRMVEWDAEREGIVT